LNSIFAQLRKYVTNFYEKASLMRIETLCIEGNALSTVHSVGALQYLLEAGHLCELKTIYCFSFGALVATVFAVHNNFKQILLEIQKPHIAQACKFMHNCIGLAILCPFMRKYMNQSLSTIVQTLLPEGVSTLGDLQNLSGKRIRILVGKSHSCVTQVFDSTRHPDTALVDLLVATCAIPFIFNPVMIEGNSFMDGILYSGFPHITIKNPRHCLLIGCQSQSQLHYGINVFQQLWNQLLSVQTERMLARSKSIMYFRMPCMAGVSIYAKARILERMYLLGALLASCEVHIHMNPILPCARMACCKVSAATIALEHPCTQEQQLFADRAALCNINVLTGMYTNGIATCTCGSSLLNWQQ